MTFIEGGPFYVGDKDGNGNVEISVRDVKLLGLFKVGDIDIELPTSSLVSAGFALAKALPKPEPLENLLKIIERVAG